MTRIFVSVSSFCFSLNNKISVFTEIFFKKLVFFKVVYIFVGKSTQHTMYQVSHREVSGSGEGSMFTLSRNHHHHHHPPPELCHLPKPKLCPRQTLVPQPPPWKEGEEGRKKNKEAHQPIQIPFPVTVLATDWIWVKVTTPLRNPPFTLHRHPRDATQ